MLSYDQQISSDVKTLIKRDAFGVDYYPAKTEDLIEKTDGI
jgi:hypothetical protein